MSDTLRCAISQKPVAAGHYRRGRELRRPIFERIVREYPQFTNESVISLEALDGFRRKYLEELIGGERGELDPLEREVVQAITDNSVLSENIELDIQENSTLGQRVADRIASFGGSWSFIITFFSILIGWMIVNAVLLAQPFDPYPFILLNLVLSCLAAIQAPIIMMSQNRQEEKDRARSEHDYKVNLKAELEIRLLHEKIDHLILHQQQRLLEIQELQTDYLQDLIREVQGLRQTPPNPEARN